jgi:hypothetical protein
MSLTRAQIAAEIAANLPDNNSESITPSIHRQTLGDVSDSLQIYSNDAYIVVQTSADPQANMLALIQAYQDASNLSPNGLPIAIDNRAVVLVPPGRYQGYFDGAQWITLGMLNNFVDVIGLSGAPEDVLITSACDATNSGTVVVVADFAIIKGITIDNTGSTRVLNDATDAAALMMVGTGQAGVEFIDCIFRDGFGASWGMRQAITYGSTFINCTGPDYSFGGNGGQFTGMAKSCTAGNHSFADEADLTGTVEDCTALDRSFASGVGMFKGTGVNCRAGNLTFGVSGINMQANGGMLWGCRGAAQAFGANGAIFSGSVLRDCLASSSFSFGQTVQSGVIFYDCVCNGGVAFGRDNFAGLAINCVSNGHRNFAGEGSFTGTILDCIMIEPENPWAPTTFTGLVSGMHFTQTGTDKNAVTIPDGATGEFEFCTFRKNGTGIPLGIASGGAATIKISYCKFNTAGGIEAGITNALGATLALAFNIGNTAV